MLRGYNCKAIGISPAFILSAVASQGDTLELTGHHFVAIGNASLLILFSFEARVDTPSPN